MGLPETMVTMMRSTGYLYRSRVFWHRTEHYKQLDRKRFRIDIEFIYMFVKSEDHYFNDKLGLQDSSLIHCEMENVKPGEFKSGFPERMAEICIKTTTRPGDFILDPYAGTCTTGVVALKNKRHFLGIEQREDTQDMIKTRLDKFDFCACDVDKQNDEEKSKIILDKTTK
jgi:site-specific DNA-methyltransferase (adenine-specific)